MSKVSPFGWNRNKPNIFFNIQILENSFHDIISIRRVGSRVRAHRALPQSCEKENKSRAVRKKQESGENTHPEKFDSRPTSEPISAGALLAAEKTLDNGARASGGEKPPLVTMDVVITLIKSTFFSRQKKKESVHSPTSAPLRQSASKTPVEKKKKKKLPQTYIKSKIISPSCEHAAVNTTL